MIHIGHSQLTSLRLYLSRGACSLIGACAKKQTIRYQEWASLTELGFIPGILRLEINYYYCYYYYYILNGADKITFSHELVISSTSYSIVTYLTLHSYILDFNT